METAPTAASWTGPRIHLRPFRAEDAAAYAAWDRDDDQARALDRVHFPRGAAAAARWAEREADREPDGDDVRLVIAANEDDAVIGDLTIHGTDPRNGTFSYGVSIAAHARGQGLAAEAITLALRHFFHERRYQKVSVGIFAFNAASIRLHERLGFTLEGRQRRMVFTRGEYHDQLLYGMTREEFDAGPGIGDVAGR
jgi:RimJ/RimL family protein N-acetyltransferase